MLTKHELKSYKETLGYDLDQLELDYFQHVVLSTLYRKHSNIYFKGGTCLQKVYGIKRFSEDLDFNYDEDLESVKKTIESTVGPISDENKTRFGTSFKTVFDGILSTPNPQSRCTISYDFIEKDTYLEPKKSIIRPPYKDLPRYILLALNKREIFAEKIRAIMTRDKARDIFDVHELLLENVDIDTELIKKKIQTYDVELTQNTFTQAVKNKEQYYDEEISRLTDIYPSFKQVSTKVLNACMPCFE